MSSTPKPVISDLTKEKGGEIEVRGFAFVPHDHWQVLYARQKSSTSRCDPLYSIMLECKLAQGSSGMYVQDVKAAPFPMCVMCFDWQLNDMERFLTCNHHFGVLSTQRTNLANFTWPQWHIHVLCFKMWRRIGTLPWLDQYSFIKRLTLLPSTILPSDWTSL